MISLTVEGIPYVLKCLPRDVALSWLYRWVAMNIPGRFKQMERYMVSFFSASSTTVTILCMSVCACVCVCTCTTLCLVFIESGRHSYRVEGCALRGLHTDI